MSYFTGICAAWVPENPAIVTAVPTTITLAPTVSTQATSAVNVAGTTVLPDPVPSAAPLPMTTITYSTHTVTVPKVSFVTSTLEGVSSTAGLVPAKSSGPSPITTGKVPIPHASSTMAATSVAHSFISSGAMPSASPVYNAASSVSIAFSLVLGSVTMLLSVMI